MKRRATTEYFHEILRFYLSNKQQELVLQDWSDEFPFSYKFHGCNRTIPEENQNASVEWVYQIFNHKSSR